eukprot:TRINITY_DN82341_c0_g1_i1.p1 TRINITY_DN82341_c0_g1~~TRINITY_DN82341_c0_g1_i1.p1  ORF type:complete len:245 (+),score=27.17 TRINITY_DN82341_c0_g1_i1:125-859(+)
MRSMPETDKLIEPSPLPRFLPRATARLCRKGDTRRLFGICCGKWEEAVHTAPELGPPALVLCDGHSLLRLPRPGFSDDAAPVEQVFEIQCLSEEGRDEKVIDIHFVRAADDSPFVSAFLVSQSHRLYWLPWPPNRNSLENRDAGYADCHYAVSVTATHQDGFILAGGRGGTYIAKANGRFETVAYPAVDEQTHMVAATALSDMWAILCGKAMTADASHACQAISCIVLLALRTLETLACLDLQC